MTTLLININICIFKMTKIIFHRGFKQFYASKQNLYYRLFVISGSLVNNIKWPMPHTSIVPGQNPANSFSTSAHWKFVITTTRNATTSATSKNSPQKHTKKTDDDVSINDVIAADNDGAVVTSQRKKQRFWSKQKQHRQPEARKKVADAAADFGRYLLACNVAPLFGGHAASYYDVSTFPRPSDCSQTHRHLLLADPCYRCRCQPAFHSAMCGRTRRPGPFCCQHERTAGWGPMSKT